MTDAKVTFGFTGTRRGMTARQRDRLRAFLRSADLVRHGDCVGSDAELHAIALELGVPVEIHPPEEDRLRAFCQGARRVWAPRSYLKRNQVIIDHSDVLLATPSEAARPAPARGQGTWSAVRYAERNSHPVIIAWPIGEVTYEEVSAEWRRRFSGE